MEICEIEIKETLSKKIKIKAENHDDAIYKIKKMYHNSEIILSADDYQDTDFIPTVNDSKIEEILQTDFCDEREKLCVILVNIGVPKDKSNIIAFEAGSSQVIVNNDYLLDIGISPYFIDKIMFYVNMFYRGD